MGSDFFGYAVHGTHQAELLRKLQEIADAVGENRNAQVGCLSGAGCAGKEFRMTKEDEVVYPEVTVRLSGQDGNVFGIIGAVKNALRAAGHRDRADGLMAEVEENCGDYDDVLQFMMKLVVVE